MVMSLVSALRGVKSSVAPGAFLGVDIGASSTKIVQLSMRDGNPTIDTYGEISNALYADAQIGQSARGSVFDHSSQLGDLMHEVRALSRLCGAAIPFGETLINTADVPKRDPEQMRKILAVEVKQYIPVSVTDYVLDWFALPEKEESAFDTMKADTAVEAHKQKIMIAAVSKKTVKSIQDIVEQSGSTFAFYELEMFSVVRACGEFIEVPTLILDFGASSTKSYVVDANRTIRSAHLTPTGGEAITKEISKTLGIDFATAEKVKRESGLLAEGHTGEAIRASLQPVWTYIAQVLHDYQGQKGELPQKVLLCGGGAYMRGLPELITEKVSLPVGRINSFAGIKGPMIMENVFLEDGPRYAVAAGLALRGIGR